METRTLVITRSYTPHQIWSWYEVIGALFTDKIIVVEAYEGHDNILGVIPANRVRDFVQVARAYPKHRVGTDLVVRMPSVVQLRSWDGSVKRNIKYSRENVYARDRYQCQYCGNKYGPENLNLDHVIPKDQKGVSNWENIVTSCIDCNSWKANRTPEQAGMKLLKRPQKPKYLPVSISWINSSNMHETWAPYVAGVATANVA